MADRKQLRIADQPDISDDDPFAELTRIMGFDPREPASRQQTADADDDDAFDIDLEKELMGDFDAFSEVAANDSAVAAHSLDAPAEPTAASVDMVADQVPQAASADEDADFFSSLEKTFKIGEPGVSGSSVSQAAVDVAPAAQAVAPAVEDDSLEAVIGALADVPSSPEGAPPLGEAAADDEFEAFFTDAVVEEFDPRSEEPSHTDLRQVAQVGGEPVAYEAAQPRGEPEAFGISDYDLGFDTVDRHDVAAAAVADPAVATDAHDDDFDMHFDQAMASLGGGDEVSSAASAPVLDHGAKQEPAARDAALPPMDLPQAAAMREPEMEEARQPSPPAELADELDMEFDEAFADMSSDGATAAAQAPIQVATVAHASMEAVAPTVPAAQDAAPAPEAQSRRESSLEDELNALLSRMKARPVVAAPASGERWRSLATPVAPIQHRPAASVPQRPLDEEVAEVRTQAPSTSAPSSGPQPFEWSRATAPAPQHTLDTAAAAEDDLDSAIMAGLADMDGAAAHEPDIDFDDHAFDAAFAAEMRQAHATVPGHGETAPVLPVAAMPEPVRGASPGYGQPTARQGVPDIETVDVPEKVVALADDLDIPDLNFEDDAPVNSADLDDLDNEFASLLNDMNGMNIAGTATAARRASYDEEAYSGYSVGGYAAGQQKATASPAGAFAGAYDQRSGVFEPEAGFAGEPFAQEPFDAIDDDAPGEAIPLSDRAFPAARQRRKGLFIAGVVGAVAVAGGLGALAFGVGGHAHGDAPAIVKADNDPIKVKPENPGGTVIPNQDSKVYDAVAKGTQQVDPAQQKLVTTAEAPLDVKAGQPDRVIGMTADGDATGSTQADATASTVKSEDRIQPTAEDASNAAGQETPVVTPRKVRTMVVKADGSLVPAEDPQAKVAASEPADPAPQHVAALGDQTGAVSATPAPALAPVANGATATMSTPARAPVAPQRPSDQPVNIVGEVKPDQVASIQPDDPAAAGSWAMQIASQPTPESAQSTYKDLARRYASVLGGHTVSIVKAEIAGKGTFYRVRVPAQSRNDAVNLCTAYKAAGGNCFVSK